MSCPHYHAGRCRSCDRMEQSPEVRLRQVTELLREHLGIAPLPPHQGEAWGFRDKIKVAVGGSVDHPALGLMAPDLSRVIPIVDCPVQAPELNALLPELLAFITRHRLTPYDVKERRGELKHLILSWSPTTQQKLLRFVLRSRESLDRIRRGLAELRAFTCVSVNLQPVPHAILEGPEEIILSEADHVEHRTSGPTLFFHPQSFMQTNSRVASALYATAVEWAAPWRGGEALDLYCGVGGFALHLAQAGHRVSGIERSPQAIDMAKRAASHNQLSAQFMAGDAVAVKQLWGERSPQLLIVNPPRRGLAETCELVLELRPEALLYSSCDIETFLADFQKLKTYYAAMHAKIFDMFPQTSHFEVLTMLVRR